jgi:hypothetical protein
MYNTTYYHAIYIDWLRTDTLTPGAYHMAFKREGKKKKKKKINEPVFSFEKEKYGSYQTISLFFFFFFFFFFIYLIIILKKFI